MFYEQLLTVITKYNINDAYLLTMSLSLCVHQKHQNKFVGNRRLTVEISVLLLEAFIYGS